MKKQLVLFIPVLAFSSLTSLKPLNAIAAQVSPSIKEDCAYKVDFEEFEIGTNEDALYQQTALFWFNESNIDASVVKYDNSNALQYTFINPGEMGGLGQGGVGNLAKLANGETYEFSIKVDLLDVSNNAELYFEYLKSSWTGVKLTKDGVVNLNGGSTFDVSYENKILKFSFVADNWASDTSMAAWMKITGLNFASGNMVIFDDVKFVKKSTGRKYNINFENETVGDSENGSIDKIWNGDTESLKIVGDENNNFLRASATGNGSDAWAKFYINNLWDLKDKEKYRLEFDVLQNNSIEWYMCYNESGGATATYSKDALLNVGNNAYNSIINTTFDGNHLVFDFTPSSLVNANFYQQVAIVVKYNQDMVFDIDNVTVTHFDNITTSFASTIDTSTVYINEDVDISSYGFTLTRKSGRVVALTESDLIIDLSKVNKSVKGSYPISVLLVDELGFEFSTTVTINYAFRPASVIAQTKASLGFTYTKDEDVYTFSNYAMRFGTTISSETYASLNEITSYGVLMLPTDMLNTSFKEMYDNREDLETFNDVFTSNSIINVTNGSNEGSISLQYDEENDSYFFGAILRNVPESALRRNISAVCYVINSNNEVFFTEQRDISISSMIDTYISTDLNLSESDLNACNALRAYIDSL